jgi:hypothetical protein
MAQPLDSARHPLSTDKTSKRLMTASCWTAGARHSPRSCYAARPPSYRRHAKASFRQSLRPTTDLPLVVIDSKRRLWPSLLAPQSEHQRPAAGSVAVLAQVDPLPCTKQQSTVADRRRDGRSHQRRLNVRRHIVGSFNRMNVWKILRRQFVERALQIGPHIVIRVFVDRDRGRGVLNENMQHSHANLLQLRQRLYDFPRDQMTAAVATSQRCFSL